MIFRLTNYMLRRVYGMNREEGLPEIVAAGLIVYRKNPESVSPNRYQYLLMQHVGFSNHWTPPKGHVDPGENTMEAAIRETEEEAGLKSTDLEIVPRQA